MRSASSGAVARDGRGARHVAEDGDLADDLVGLDLGHLDLAGGGIDDDVGRAGQHDIGGVALVALVEERLPGVVADAVGGEGQQLQLGRRDRENSGTLPQHSDFIVQQHRPSNLAVRYRVAYPIMTTVRVKIPFLAESVSCVPSSTTSPPSNTMTRSNSLASAGSAAPRDRRVAAVALRLFQHVARHHVLRALVERREAAG